MKNHGSLRVGESGESVVQMMFVDLMAIGEQGRSRVHVRRLAKLIPNMDVMECCKHTCTTCRELVKLQIPNLDSVPLLWALEPVASRTGPNRLMYLHMFVARILHTKRVIVRRLDKPCQCNGGGKKKNEYQSWRDQIRWRLAGRGAAISSPNMP